MSPQEEAAGKEQLMHSGLVMAGLPPQRAGAPVQVAKPNWLASWWARAWHDFLLFWGLRPDWTNPDNAPPAWEALPHKYLTMPDLKCCAKCGGGRNHQIHEVGGGR